MDSFGTIIGARSQVLESFNSYKRCTTMVIPFKFVFGPATISHWRPLLKKFIGAAVDILCFRDEQSPHDNPVVPTEGIWE